MWSDAADPAWLAEAGEALRGLELPAPGTLARRELPAGVPARRWVHTVRSGPESGIVWLDGGITSRHFVAWDPLLTVAASRGQITLTGGGHQVVMAGRAFDMLELLEHTFARTGRKLFGYLGYELVDELEDLPPPPAPDVEVPELWLELHDTWIEVSGGRSTLVSSRRRDGAHVDAMADGLGRVAATRGSGGDRSEAAGSTREGAAGPAILDRLRGTVVVEPDDAAYERAVARVVESIHGGDLFQTNLCRRFAAPRRPSRSLYDAMRATGDAAYGAWIGRPEWDVFSRSPECFVSVRGGRVESRPIKGTRRRGADPGADAKLRDELLSSTKDGAELAMIVDLVRNDLGRVCVPGSVRVAAHRELMELATVWHTVSRVTGELPDTRLVPLLRASFPPGSITGAPKIQAVAEARQEETVRRGPAMGAVGWIEPGAGLELSVAIRTAVADRERVVYHAGCGIVADSDPREEREESLVKAAPFLSAFGS